MLHALVKLSNFVKIRFTIPSQYAETNYKLTICRSIALFVWASQHSNIGSTNEVILRRMIYLFVNERWGECFRNLFVFIFSNPFCEARGREITLELNASFICAPVYITWGIVHDFCMNKGKRCNIMNCVTNVAFDVILYIILNLSNLYFIAYDSRRELWKKRGFCE